MKIEGIKYVGPVFDGSGYAKSIRENILALDKAGIPVTIDPIQFEVARPDLGKDAKLLNSMVDKKINYNFNIIHTTPEFWEKHLDKKATNVGLTMWETTKLHKLWPNYINNNVDKVLTVCDWNKEVFINSGITVPIGVTPIPIDLNYVETDTVFNVAGLNDDTYAFYSINQWCYDDQTRVLTKSGFKYFKELLYSDEVATLNKETDELEYYLPEKIVKFRRKDKMLKLTSTQFNICVTPDHKMVVKEHIKGSYGVNSEDSWELIPFNELLSTNKKGNLIVSDKYRAKKNCKWVGKEQSVFNVPQLGVERRATNKGAVVEINMDLFLEFLGWYLSEGSAYKGNSGNYINIISQTKVMYRKEIIACIEKMGYTVITHGDKDIEFNSREMYYYLKQFGTAKQKFIPEFVKQLSARQIFLFLNSLFKGDGSMYKNGDWVKYTTTSNKLAYDVIECLLKVGMSGSVSTADSTLKTPGKIKEREIKGKLLQYTVSVNRQQNEPSMYYANLEEIDYDGYVYCAEVKNHTMFVERNGKVIFSGNTERKNPIAVIKSFWWAFQNNENVALVYKTYRSDYRDEEKNAIRMSIKRLKQMMPMDSYPPIYLITDMLTEDEVRSLHLRGDCYVSLDRGEGFGLGSAYAGAFGNPIIVTGFGGTTEFAKPDNSYLINYTLTPVSGMPWSNWYSGDQLWAEADIRHAAETMRYVYENQEEAKQVGLKLKEHIRENLSYEVIGNKIIKELESI